jgi:hypothetical protein
MEVVNVLKLYIDGSNAKIYIPTYVYFLLGFYPASTTLYLDSWTMIRLDRKLPWVSE